MKNYKIKLEVNIEIPSFAVREDYLHEDLYGKCIEQIQENINEEGYFKMTIEEKELNKNAKLPLVENNNLNSIKNQNLDNDIYPKTLENIYRKYNASNADLETLKQKLNTINNAELNSL